MGPSGIVKGDRAAIRAAPRAINVIDSIFSNSKPRLIFMVTILQKRMQACQVLYSAVTIVSILILGIFKKKFSHD